MCHFSFAHGPKFDILEFSGLYTAIFRGIQSDVNRRLWQWKYCKYEAVNLKNVDLKSWKWLRKVSLESIILHSHFAIRNGSLGRNICGVLAFHLWCEYEPVSFRGEQQHMPLARDRDGSHIAYVKTSLISSVGRAPDCTARDHRPRHSLTTNQTFQITAKISALCQLMWLCPLTRALLFTKNIYQIQYCNVSILISCRVFFLNRRDVFRNSSCCSWLRSWILNMACLHTLRNQTLSGLMTW